MNNYIRKVTINMETIDEDWPLVEALKQGKTIQYFAAGVWRNYGFETQSNEIDFNLRTQPRRIKPTPTIRPWKPKEVPVGAVLRWRDKDARLSNTIILYYGLANTQTEYVCFYDTNGCKTGHSLFGCLKDCEHSLDHGKTWLTCGVEENV